MKNQKPEILASLKMKLETGSLLDSAEAAAFLGLSIFTVRALVARREIPFLKLGAAVRFDPAEMQRYREQRRVPTLAEEIRARKAASAAGSGQSTRKIAAAGAGA